MAVIRECYLIEGLERAFRAIHAERMAGLPILNPALEVEAVGFLPWSGHCAGVLVTPWLMNLLVLPPEGDGWHDGAVGDRLNFDFPAGPCEMELCEEAMLGRYLSRALYSPMGAFAGHDQAVELAAAIMDRMMTPAPAAPRDAPPEPGRRALLRGLFAAARG